MNILLARLQDVPSFLASECQVRIQVMLDAAHTALIKINSATDRPKMQDDFWFAEDDWRSQYRPYKVKDGILHLPVKGVLLHDFGYQVGDYATGYTYIQKAWERGQADPNVKAIAEIIDSPGGEVAGNFDLVDKMFADKGKKPVRAFAAESAYSAAYSIASAADDITVSRTGGVGSIGVVMMHVDMSAALDKAGFKVTFIKFGKHKTDGNPYESLPAAVQARYQDRIDELGEVFVSTVARNRSMDAKAIRSTEALTYTATQAKSNGLADGIGSLDDSLAAFAADLSEGANRMTTTTQDKSAVDQAALDAARAAGVAEGKTQAVAEAAKAERARVQAIIGSEEAKTRPKAALSVAMNTDMTVEQAAVFLKDLQPEVAGEAPKLTGDKDGKSDFHRAMDSSKNPNVGADLQADGTEKVVDRVELAFGYAGKAKKTA